MTIVFSICGLMLAAAIVLAFWRMARGPTVLDRILTFDLITTSAVGMIILLAMAWETALYMELIMIYALLGFLGSTALVFYLHRTYGRDGGEEPAEADPPTGRRQS